MLTALRPNLQAAPTGAPRVASPHAPAPSAAASPDAVVLSAPVPVDPPAAPNESGRKTALVAAGLAAAVLTGVLAPVVGSLLNSVPTDVASQSVTVALPGGVARHDGPASQPQDPAQLVGAMAVAAEQSAHALPQINQVHAGWATDLGAIRTTARDLGQHVDALLRDAKKDAATHHAAIDSDLAGLTRQVADLQARVGKEQPGVDQFLGQNRDNLNQLGTISFNLGRNIDQTAGQYGYFSPQRQALRQLGGEVNKATLDLSMSTEKTTVARADDKALAENLKVVQQAIDQVKKAHDARQMGQVDSGARALENAFKVLDTVTQESQRAVDEAAARAHRGAEDLAVVYKSLGGQRQAPTPAQQP